MLKLRSSSERITAWTISQQDSCNIDNYKAWISVVWVILYMHKHINVSWWLSDNHHCHVLVPTIIFSFFFCIVCLLALAFFTSFTQAAFKQYVFILPTISSMITLKFLSFNFCLRLLHRPLVERGCISAVKKENLTWFTDNAQSHSFFLQTVKWINWCTVFTVDVLHWHENNKYICMMVKNLQVHFISMLSNLTPEKHFCLINSCFQVSSLQIFIHL